MKFDEHKQFFSNESLIASMGGNMFAYNQYQDVKDEEMAECPQCMELKSVSELIADDMCDCCFAKEEAKRVEENNNRWLKGD